MVGPDWPKNRKINLIYTIKVNANFPLKKSSKLSIVVVSKSQQEGSLAEFSNKFGRLSRERYSSSLFLKMFVELDVIKFV